MDHRDFISVITGIFCIGNQHRIGASRDIWRLASVEGASAALAVSIGPEAIKSLGQHGSKPGCGFCLIVFSRTTKKVIKNNEDLS